MKMMLLAAAAALTLGSATTFAATVNNQDTTPQTHMYTQYGQSTPAQYSFTAPSGSGVNFHHTQRNTDWEGSSGNG